MWIFDVYALYEIVASVLAKKKKKKLVKLSSINVLPFDSLHLSTLFARFSLAGRLPLVESNLRISLLSQGFLSTRTAKIHLPLMHSYIYIAGELSTQF